MFIISIKYAIITILKDMKSNLYNVRKEYFCFEIRFKNMYSPIVRNNIWIGSFKSKLIVFININVKWFDIGEADTVASSKKMNDEKE